MDNENRYRASWRARPPHPREHCTMASLLAAGLGCAALVAACGVGSNDNGPGSAGGGATMGAGGGVTSGPGPSTSGGPADAGLPPEKEVESSYGAPVATGKYVWVANPSSGRVAYIDAATLEARTVEAGNGPTYLAALDRFRKMLSQDDKVGTDDYLVSALLNQYRAHLKATRKSGAPGVFGSNASRFA